jgi:type IX secretion system substrate protein
MKRILLLIIVAGFASANLVAQTAPTLVSPVDADACLGLNTTFEWTAEPNAVSYTLQITSSGSFSPPSELNVSGLTSNTLNVDLATKSADHHWRVAAHYAGGSIVFSGAFTFRTIDGGPVIQTPLDNSNWHPLLTTFTWFSNSSTNYNLQVATDANFTSIIFDNDVITDPFQDVALSNYATNYYWRVRGIKIGCWSDWSETFSFTTLVDKPDLVEPANNSTCLPLENNFKWDAVPGGHEYAFEVYNSNTFIPENLVHAATISNTQQNVTLPENYSQYWWRVSATVTGDNITDWSNVWNLKTIQEGPQPITPPHQSKGVPFATTFVWDDDKPHDTYTLQISDNENFNPLVIEETTLASSSYNANLPTTRNTKYYWRVNSNYSTTFSDCESDWSNTFTFKTPFDAPLLRSPFENRECLPLTYEFEWYHVDNALGYEILVAEDAAFTTIAYQNDKVQDLFQEVVLEKGLTTYYWKVRVNDKNNIGDWSPIRDFTTTIGVAKLHSPENGIVGLSLNPTLTWKATAANATYSIQVSTTPEFEEEFIVDSADDLTVNTFSATIPLYSMTYYWRVKASTANCTNDWSAAWTFTTHITAPTLLFPENNEADIPHNVVLKWERVEGSSAYELLVSTEPDFSNIFIGTSGLAAPSYFLTGLAAQTTYYWKVRTNSPAGKSDWSAPFIFTTTYQGTNVPTLISPAYASEKVAVNVILNWTGANAGDKFHLQVSKDKNMEVDVSAIIIDEDNLTTESYQMQDLDNFTTYFWRVSAINDSGETKFSKAWYFRTIAQLPTEKPILTYPVDGTLDHNPALIFRWLNVDRAETYHFQLSQDENFTVLDKDIPVVAKNSLSVLNLDHSARYYWKVRSQNEAGYGPWSDASVFNTKITSVDDDVSKLYGVSVYPNPASETANLNFRLSEPVQVTVKVIDLLGNVIAMPVSKSFSIGNKVETLDFSNISNGSYLLIIQLGNDKVMKQIVINK